MHEHHMSSVGLYLTFKTAGVDYKALPNSPTEKASANFKEPTSPKELLEARKITRPQKKKRTIPCGEEELLGAIREV